MISAELTEPEHDLPEWGYDENRFDTNLCKCNNYGYAPDCISMMRAGTKIKLGNYCWKPSIAQKDIIKKIVWSVATDWPL